MTDKDLAKIDDIEKLALISAHAGGIDLPKPFEREIYLFDTHVAGTTHIEKIKSIEPFLKIGDKVNFYREPTNPHDPQAIRIENQNKDKIGYVPRADNVVFARLMDAGKNLYGKITSKEWQDDWLKVEIRIYLWEI